MTDKSPQERCTQAAAGQSRLPSALSTKAQAERHGVPGRGRRHGMRTAPSPAPPPASYYSCAAAVLTALARVNAAQLCACNLAQSGAGKSRSTASSALSGAVQLLPHLTAFCCKKSRNCSSAPGSERSVKYCFTSRVSCSAHTHSVRLPCAHSCMLPRSGLCGSCDNPLGSSAPGHSRWSRCE